MWMLNLFLTCYCGGTAWYFLACREYLWAAVAVFGALLNLLAMYLNI
jgi:hypothetical protein